MSSVNRVLKKRREATKAEEEEQPQRQDPNQNQNFKQPQTFYIQEKSQFDKEKEETFQSYVDLSKYNPSGFCFSNEFLPASTSLYSRFKAPLSCIFSPINLDLEYVSRSGDKIPRCGSCRAYLNYYCETNKKGFKCFLCGRENFFTTDYNIEEPNIELQQHSYLVDGPQNIYNSSPPENAMIFLVDVSQAAHQSKMLYYLGTVIKEVLSKEEMNEVNIYFFTYDEVVHEYDFSGEEIRCNIVDQTIKDVNTRSPDNSLHQIRSKFFQLLDLLEEISEKNTKQASNFYSAFEYVYEAVKHTAGKIFIFQANQNLSGELFIKENAKIQGQIENSKVKGILQTKNKIFFNKFVQGMLVDNISCSMFVFSRGFKNLKVFGDSFKLTNSEILYYNKDVGEDLMKFYYDLYHLLGATYFVDVRLDLIISAGWYFTAVYGNLYRLKEYISFKICHYESSKKVCAMFLPQEGYSLPYFSFQLVTNYIYARKHFMSVNTTILPLTTSLDRLFQNMHLQITSTTLFKVYLSTLRLEELNTCKLKYIKHVAGIWRAAMDHFKKNLNAQTRSFFLGLLGFLKNYHFQIDLVIDSTMMDRIICQRNHLQGVGSVDCSNAFNPYLFNIQSMSKEMCREDIQFEYPELCELKFSSVKEGIFLLDCGLGLYLYLGKSFAPQACLSLFGKEKLLKTDILNEELIWSQNSILSSQLQVLVRILRQQKAFGWIPLYVVRCGENTLNEKLFYLNFIEEKYEEFRSYKISFPEFTNMLEQQF